MEDALTPERTAGSQGSIDTLDPDVSILTDFMTAATLDIGTTFVNAVSNTDATTFINTLGVTHASTFGNIIKTFYNSIPTIKPGIHT